MDSRLQYESLAGWMDFLAFLVQKFKPNYWKINWGILTNPEG